jgi:charged multivesicular body protein 3
MRSLDDADRKTKGQIKAAARRNDMKSAKMLAREVYRAKKQKERLHKSKAQLNSIKLQVDEAFAIQKIQGTMKTSTTLMKEVNSLVRLPELMGTMNVLGQELMKAGIIEEMISDTILEDGELEDSEAEEEVEGMLNEIIGNKINSAGKVPTVAPPQQEAPESAEEEEDEQVISSMKERLRALQS